MPLRTITQIVQRKPDAPVVETITCPFCHEVGFDLIGLKRHFAWRDAFNETPTQDPKP